MGATDSVSVEDIGVDVLVAEAVVVVGVDYGARRMRSSELELELSRVTKS